MKLKRILIIFSLILISLSFYSCNYLLNLIFNNETGMNTSNIVITVLNNSSSEYKVRFYWEHNIDDSDFATFNKQGSLSNKFSVSYTCTINEDNTISFSLSE